MSSTRPVLRAHDVRDYVAEHVFQPSGDPNGLGVELEWLTSQGGREHRLPMAAATELIDTLSPLPRGSRITLEPGGQLELSSEPFPTIDELCDAAEADLVVLDTACEATQVELIALGADPVRTPERVAVGPRYQAMERYFDQLGPAGRTMMCNTAAIQVNVGLGDRPVAADRWELANRMAPTLLACFANSPFAHGQPSGWQSSRLRAWWALDPTRAAPVSLDLDPIDAWASYALDARVMLIRQAEDRCLPVVEPMRFGEWLTQGHELGFPTMDDFSYHLTTLFPPVRPQGWLELRMFDALPSPAWEVAVAVTCILLSDHALADDISDAVTGTERLWVDAAQLGLGHPALARSAVRLFDLAAQALATAGVSTLRRDLVEAFTERWVARGRSPADDRLDAWRHDGQLFPPAESVAALAGGALVTGELRRP